MRYLLLLLLTSTQAFGSSVANHACYLSGSSTACFEPVNVASGGTGLTAGTSGGIPGFTATGTITSSALLPANGVLYGGGAGFTPGATAAGTNNQSLLAVTSGAPVWGAVPLNSSAAVTGTLPVANGGTNGATAQAGFDSLSPLATKGDTLVYSGSHNVNLAVGTNGQVLTADSTQTNGLAWETAGGGNGAGAITYMTTAAQSSATGWAASGAGITVATDSTAADLPQPNVVGTALKVTGVSGSTAYAYYAFTLDPGDYNKVLATTFYINALTGYVASDFQVSMNSCTVAWSSGTCSGTSARLALSTDVSAISALPAGLEGIYRTTFSSPGSAAKYIQLQIGLNTTATHSMVFSSIYVGPQAQAQGAALSEPVTWTPTGSWSTNTTYTGVYWRTGSRLKAYVKVSLAGAPNTATALSINMPTGLTINSSAVDTTTNANIFGQVQAQHSSAAYTGQVTSNGNTTSVDILYQSSVTAAQTNLDTTHPVTWASTDVIEAWFEVPTNEWAGSGTVNIVNNDCSWAYNTSTADSNDSTSFGYGPAGTQFGSFTALRTKVVQFLSPIGSTDNITIEWFDGYAWKTLQDSVSGFQPYSTQNATTYGMGSQVTSNTQVTVNFGQYRIANGSSYGAAGAAWSGIAGNSTILWRVKRCTGPSTAGFSNYIPGTSAGLVPMAGLPGNTTTVYTCNNYPAGIVGECFERNSNANTSITSGTIADVDSTGITLTPGTWDITASVQFTPTGSTSITRIQSWIGTATGNVTTGQDLTRNYIEFATAANVLGNVYAAPLPTWRVSISANTSYYLKAASTFTASTLTANANLRATRVN